MSSIKLRLIAGIVLSLMPFLGFPSFWKTIFYCAVGVLLIIDSIRSYTESKMHV